MEPSLETLNHQEGKYTAEMDAALAQYTELQQQAADMDAVELDTARHAIRPDQELEAAQRLQAAYGKKFDSRTLAQSRKDVAALLDEDGKPISICQRLQRASRHQKKRHSKKDRGQER